MWSNNKFDRAGAIVAWNDTKLSGYALNAGGFWFCVDASQPNKRRQICHRSADAIVWLRQATGAMRYQTLADRDALDALLIEQKSQAPVGEMLSAADSAQSITKLFGPCN